jgi:glycosyltransferase involved in cell wall biosynthesis
MTRIIHLSVREGLSQVYLPQVVRPMSILRNRGSDLKLVVLSAVGERLRKAGRVAWARQLRSIRNDFGLELVRLPAPPKRLPGLWSEAGVFKRWLARHIGPQERALIHCRGAAAARIGLCAVESFPNVRVIFDCRGLGGPEFAYENGFADAESAPPHIRKRAAEIENAERQVARSADAVLCVSSAMREYIETNWGVAPERLAVVPCATEVPTADVRAKALKLRAKLGFGDRFVLVYSGSLASWQMPEESVELFRRLRALRPGLHLLGLTPQPGRLADLLRNARVPEDGYTVMSVPHAEVPEHLAAADCAVLVRAPCAVNSVASPVKLAEYLAADLPVILSKGIGDYSEMVAREGLGSVLPRLPGQLGASDCATVLADVDGVQAGLCASVARRKLDWSVAADAIERLWLELAGSGPVVNGNIERKLDAEARAAG